MSDDTLTLCFSAPKHVAEGLTEQFAAGCAATLATLPEESKACGHACFSLTFTTLGGCHCFLPLAFDAFAFHWGPRVASSLDLPDDFTGKVQHGSKIEMRPRVRMALREFGVLGGF